MKGRLGAFISFMLLSFSVWAEDPVANGSSMMSSMLMFGVIFAMMYFLMIRPQSKKQKEHKNLLSKLSKGDEVLTSGGILGKISRVTDQFLIVSIADGIEIMVQKQAVAQALPKGTIKSI